MTRWDNTTIREAERHSIREWVGHAAKKDCFHGKRVLDVGCGLQPYRLIVEDFGGSYFGYDHPDFPGSTVDEEVGEPPWQTKWGAILCTQVLQYQAKPHAFIHLLYHALKDESPLVITWPTCWDEVEATDLFRFTHQGGLELLREAGFRSVESRRRAQVELNGFKFPLGYGAIAWK